MPKLIMEVKNPNAQDAGTKATETLGDITSPKQPEKSQDTVPLSKYMAEKNKSRELESLVAELSKSKGSDTIEGRLSTLADKYDASPELLKEVEKVIAESQKSAIDSVDEKIKAILPEITELKNEKRAKEFDTVFKERFNALVEDMPEYKDVANVEVLKALAQLPQNAHLTLQGLVESTYGSAVRGRKSIETGTPTGDGNKTQIDFSKMTDDDWEKVKSNPELKAQYGEYIQKNLSF